MNAVDVQDSSTHSDSGGANIGYSSPGAPSTGAVDRSGADDHALLAAFAQVGNQAAFAELVHRHLDWVYSCALRQVRDRHLAEDVVQVVFEVLARKAGRVTGRVVIAGWLFNTVRYAAANALREARRRSKREQEAALMNQAIREPAKTPADAAAWESVSPHLEEALAQLPAHERDAVLLRYFEGQSLRATGAALKISEDAAAKRVSRAIERLRQILTRKGVAAPAAMLLASLLSTSAVQAAPASLGASVAGGSAVSGAVEVAADQVIRAVAMAKAKMVGALIGVAIICGVIAQVATRNTVPAPKVVVQALPAAVGPVIAIHPLANPGNGIMRGFPVALPGAIVGSAAVADLDGDGILELVVPTIHGNRGPLAHPEQRIERLVFAIRSDGTSLPGWPAVVTDRRNRLAQLAAGGNQSNWGTSPSIADVDGDGRSDVIVLDVAGTIEIKHMPGRGPVVRRIANGGDGLASAPLVDLDGDGRLDFAMGWVLTTIDGRPISGWPPVRTVRGGFAPAVTLGARGQPRLYLPTYVDDSLIRGLDRFGRPLPGWPRPISSQTFSVSMGDIDGDGALEVGCVDGARQLHLWSADGERLPSTHAIGIYNSVFQTGVAADAPVFADLDGDGRDEVIVADVQSQSIKAWRGDGRGLTAADGVIAKLQSPVRVQGGVSVADLGDAGVIDLFAGTSWVRLHRDGRAEVIDLLPAGSHATPGLAVAASQPAVTPPTNNAGIVTPPNVAELPVVTAYALQPTLADVNGDGKLDVVITLSDGRVFVYETGKPYRPECMLWPTDCGNLRRTGSRTPPAYRAISPANAAAQSGPIAFIVNDATSKVPVAGASLIAAAESGQIPFATDSNGKASVRIPDGRISAVWISKPGYAGVRVDLQGAREPAAGGISVDLPAAAPVGGFVRNDAGQPIIGARVFLSATGRTPLGHEIDVLDVPTVTDELGRWVISAAPAQCDALYLRVEHPEYLPEQARVGRTAKSRQAFYERSALTILLPRRSQTAKPAVFENVESDAKHLHVVPR